MLREGAQKKRDVFVILPPVVMEAYSAAMRSYLFSVHAMLEKGGIQAELFDFRNDHGGFERFYRSIGKDVTGDTIFIVAVFLNNWEASFRLLKRISSQNVRSRWKTILVGPYATYFYETFLKDGLADIVVLADAEFTVLNLLRTGLSHGLMASFFNIAFKVDGEILCKNIKWTDRLDEIPFLSPYFIAKPVSPVIVLTSRGCSFPCTFCDKKVLWGQRVRFRSVENIFTELRMLEARGVRDFDFGDDNLLFDPLRVESLCRQMIKKKMSFRWKCDSRVDAVSPEILKLMRLSGCHTICFGVESGSLKVRCSLGKKFSDKDIMNAVLWAKKAGIAVELYMLLGSSCEDVKSLQDTKKLLMRLQPLKAVVQNPLVLAPGSSLYEEYLFAHKKKKDFILKQKYPVCYRKNLSARSRVPERKK